MATVTVSNSSQRKSALTSAKGNTTIVLESGDYDALDINGNSPSYNFNDVTITSKSTSNPAVFTVVNLSNVDDVTFEGIKFDYSNKSDGPKPFVFNNTNNISILNSEVDGMLSGGHGSGHGLWVKGSSDFLVKNTDLSDFAKAIVAYSTSDIQVIDNSITGVAVDGMLLSRIDGALHRGQLGRDGRAHWHRPPGHDPVLEQRSCQRHVPRHRHPGQHPRIATETVTHGIYMANEVARRTGDLDDFYREHHDREATRSRAARCFGIARGRGGRR